MIEEILEGLYKFPKLRRKIVPLFMGNPGIAKSVKIKEFADKKGVNLVKFTTSSRNPFEISGMVMPNRDTKKMSVWDFDLMLNMKDNDILFFDEIFNGNPAVLNACLTLLEDRITISGKKLADIIIVAAANPQGMVPLTPQIKERFVFYYLDFNSEEWIHDHMIPEYNITQSIGNKLAGLVGRENFTGGGVNPKYDSNYCSSRSISKAVDMILHGLPTPYEKEVKIILEELVENEFSEPVVLNEEKGLYLQPNEKITWLQMARHLKGLI